MTTRILFKDKKECHMEQALMPCDHDFLSPTTTLCVSPLQQLVWCVYCARQRRLAPVDGIARAIAVAARDSSMVWSTPNDNIN